jgi:hypothetical protein
MQWFIPIIAVLLLTSTWFVFHFTQTGWFFATTAKGWSQQRGIVDGKGLFKNSISIFRSFIDLGIIILTILSLFYWISTRKLDKLMLLWLIPAIVFSISFLPFTNPINHRYFLIVFVLMLFSVIQFLSEQKIIFTLFTFVLLWIGHLQIYPVPVSNGWDCSLVYTSYNSCRTDFFTFLENRVDIKPSEIGTVFPMNASLYQTSLEKDTIRMQNVNGQSIDSIPYVLYTTIGNDFSDEQLEQVRKWQVVYKVNHSLIELILFKNPEFYLK